MDKSERDISNAIIYLLKGILNRKDRPAVWNIVSENRAEIEDYLSKIGLRLIFDTTDGYAYLKSETYENEEDAPIKLVIKRQLDFVTSFLLMILRKELIYKEENEFDDMKTVSEDEIIAKMTPYFAQSSDEIKLQKKIRTAINNIEKLGFLRRLKSSDEFEIQNIIKSYVDAETVSEYNARLKKYIDYAKGNEDE